MGGISNKIHDHFRFFLLFFFYSSSLESISIFQMLSFPKSFAGSSERNFEIVCCSYFVHQIKRCFTIHILQVPLFNTVTQPPASVSCRVPSTCGSTTRNLQLSPRTNGRTTEFPCDRIAPHLPGPEMKSCRCANVS